MTRASRLAVLLLLLAGGSAGASGRRTIVIIAPGLEPEDLSRPELQALHRLAPQAATGWMNVRTARNPSGHPAGIAAICLTLGAGSRAAASEPIQEVTPELAERLTKRNASLDHRVEVGALGRSLRAAGISTAVIGNLDDTQPHREASLVIMPPDGRIALDLSGARSLVRDPSAPFGVRADLGAYAGHSQAFQLWVFGDVGRAVRYAPLCLAPAAAAHHSAALKRLHDLLSLAETEPRESRAAVLFISPPLRSDRRLAPVLEWGECVQPGRLRSASTHRSGLVTATDFLPSVIRDLGLPAASRVGQPWRVSRAPVTAEQWSREGARLARVAEQQSVFGGLPTLQLAILASAALLASLRGRPDPDSVQPRAASLLAGALPLALLAMPLASLLLPALHPVSAQAAAAMLACALAAPVAVALAAPVAVAAIWPPTRAGIALAIVTLFTAAVALDLLAGQTLLRDAWMSYSVTEGARFYGIGNEMGGALAASSLVIGAHLRGRTGSWVPPTILLALIAALIGFPGFGANAGCFIAAVAGLLASSVVWSGRRLRFIHVLAGIALIAILLVLLAWWDAGRASGAQTHIARAVTEGGGLAGMAAIAWRKAALNLWLLWNSPWSPAGLAAGALLALSSVKRIEAAGDSMAPRGFMAGIAASAFTILVFNDSGIVAASELLLVTWAAWALWMETAAGEPASLDKCEAAGHTEQGVRG